MIRYKLTTKAGEVFVSLESEQPNKVAPIRYEGDPRAVMLVKRWLAYEIGTDGRVIADWCAPADLKSVMSKNGAGTFAPSLVEEQMGLRKVAATEAEGGG
jgi:hypothetical protein